MENPPGNYYPPQQQRHYPPPLPDHPEATLVMILGILSIPLSCSIPIVGFVLGIISVSKANRNLREMVAMPDRYSMTSMNSMRTGKTCGTIGIVFGSIVLLFVLLYILIYVVIIGIFLSAAAAGAAS